MKRSLELVIGTALGLLACSPSPQPCMGVGTCPEGSECLANRCTLLGADPVSADTRRVVVAPRAMAVVSAAEHASSELPAAVTFGSSAGGAALYLEFPEAWRGARRIESAFLVLEPLPGTPRGPTDVEVRVWRVGGDWAPDSLSWLDQPSLVPPSASGLARAAPALPLRVDVTAIVAHFAEHERGYHGLALRSGGGDDVGASFATGASGGVAPRLELYVR